jgi:predicted dehydrogenase
MTKTINWGIIGAGKIADKFATDLATIQNVKLVAIASNSIERAKDFAQKHQISHYYDSYKAIFETPDLDVIYIATPHTFHAENTILCLENKVAVLCEKPFAMNLKQVQQMIEVANRNNTFLMEAMWTRFLPAIKKTLELIEEGKIGKIKTIHADFGFPAPDLPEKRLLNPMLGGGALLDIGIYPAFISLLLLGYPSDIQALTTFTKTGVDETCSFILKFKDETTALLNCSIATKTRTEALIYGEKGYIELPTRFIETNRLILHENDKESIEYRFDYNTKGYNFEAEEVTNCLREGKKESSLMPLSMSVKLISLLDEIRQKAGIFYEGVD